MFFLRSQTGHRRLTVAVAGVALAALLAACGSSGGSSSAGPASDTSSPAGTTNTAADTATDTAAATGTGAGTDSAPGAGGGATDAELASATALVAQWTAPLTAASYPTPTTLTKKVDIKGKTVYLVPLTDQGVIHSIVVGVEQALTAAGAKYKVCDGGAGGQPNPTNWGNCLKAAGDANADIVMSLLIDYNAVSTQFNALIKKGIPVLIAGVQDVGLTAVPGKAAIYDNTARLKDAYGKLAVSALAHGGKDTNTLWLRLLDSTATTNASDAGIAKSKEICAGCDVQSADFTTANSQAQLAATVSAALVKHPDLNAVVVPADTFTPLVIQGIQNALMSFEMLVIGDGRPTAHRGATLWNSEKDDISKDTWGIDTARNLGHRVAEVALAMAGAEKFGSP